MSPSRNRASRIWVAGVAVAGLLTVTFAAPAAARSGGSLAPDASYQLSVAESYSSAKSNSGQLAESDPTLLARTDTAVTPVMVKVDVDPVASYTGGVDGYAATSPEVTGRAISDGSAAIDAYTAYVQQAIAAAQAEALALIPSAKMLTTYATVYGGFSMAIPANRAKDLLALGSVAAVQGNELRQAAANGATPAPSPTATSTTTSTPAATPTPTATPKATATPTPTATPKATATPTPTPTPKASTPSNGTGAPNVTLPPTTPAPDADSTTFIGADKAWTKLGGRDKAGEGVIVGVIDSGIWPEHPMLVDNGIAKPAGGPWACQFGDGSVGPTFTCNDKLIGAYAFLATYQSTSNAAGAADYCNGALCSARDSNGHGTHTATTAAGSYVASAPVLGVERGPISGIAPGASVIAYRALGPEGGYDGDLLAAINQAVLDGVDVLNYSISGSANPYDAVELAFLDAFAAGITVNSSAGNDGPGSSTLDHASPWTTTVGASTFDRAFTSALVLASSDGATYVKQGVTITAGVTSIPVVTAASLGIPLCDAALPAASVTGKVVVCERGVNARVEKGYNVLQAGGAGMILANPTASDVETDNHFLPTIHLEGPNGDLYAFIAAHPNVTATWAAGQATVSQGDVMAAFSSRGPVTDYLKPDVTAPGVQILAGNTPTPTELAAGPAGQLYQAIAGTSMSSPHAAGVSALVKAAHPNWTPGQIKSALMTSSLQTVLDYDGTPAGVFERGAGTIRADRALAPVITISETAADFYASADDALHRVDLNIPSINVDPLPGAVSTKRTVTNVSGKSQTFTVKATAADGVRITVTPARFTLTAGKSRDITVIIDGLNAADGWHEGQITITPSGADAVKAVLPVAVNVGEADISLSQTCDPTTIKKGKTTTCTVTAANYLPVEVDAKIDVVANPLLQLTSVTSPAKKKALSASWSGNLTPALPATVESVAIEPNSSPAGFIPLGGFGGTLVVSGLGDESITNLNVPSFSYGSETYSRIGVVSNGYLVVGGGTAADVEYSPNGIPDPAAPNNILAPLWTDSDLSSGGRVLANVLTDGVNDWLIIEYENVPTYSGNATNSFQVWIGLNGSDDITYVYGADAVGDSGSDIAVGAENRDGTSGKTLSTLPEEDDEVLVTTAPPTAGGTVSFDYTLKGLVKGTWSTFATLRSDAIRTTPIEQTKITVQ